MGANSNISSNSPVDLIFRAGFDNGGVSQCANNLADWLICGGEESSCNDQTYTQPAGVLACQVRQTSRGTANKTKGVASWQMPTRPPKLPFCFPPAFHLSYNLHQIAGASHGVTDQCPFHAISHDHPDNAADPAAV